MSELLPARVLRRTLEEALTAKVASAVLFEALGASGSAVPRSLSDILIVVHGPLTEILTRRIGVEPARDLAARIETALRPIWDTQSTVDAPLDVLAQNDGGSERDAEATAAFPTQRHPVMVAIIASGSGFEQRLATALGPQRAAPFTVSGLADLARLRKDPPSVLLIDAADFPAIPTDGIMKVARALPRASACVLWGVELPFGRNFARTLEGEERPWITLGLREGIAPLLDLIRSRRSRD